MSIFEVFSTKKNKDRPVDQLGNGPNFIFGRTTAGKPVNERGGLIC